MNWGSDLPLRVNHLTQGPPARQLLRGESRWLAGGDMVLNGPQPAPGLTRQIDTTIDHQPGDNLSLMPPPDMELLVRVEFVALISEHLFR